MDARLEAAILDVLERFGDSAVAVAGVTDAWLREHHPAHWQEIRQFLAFEARVAGGSPDATSVGPWRLLRRLGRGGAGTVYLALRDGDAEPVALKVLHGHLASHRGFVERVLTEARAAAAIRHPNVVRTLDAGVAPGPEGPCAFVATAYVEGQNLRGLLAELGPLGEPLVRHVTAEILRALEAIHAEGVVHGDLKPENVLIAPGEVVKVADVGALSPSTEAEGDEVDAGEEDGDRPFRGTALYAAPEQLSPGLGRVDGRADLFALGVMVEELLSGALPDARSRDDAERATDGSFFGTFAATLRAPRLADRFGSAREALDVLAAGETSQWWRERATAPSGRRSSPPRRGPRAVSLHGRQRELDRLLALLDAALAGANGAALVTGSAGTGKTRLVEALASAAVARDALVVWCAFGDRGADPVAAALRRALASTGIDAREHATAAEGVELDVIAWLGGEGADRSGGARPAGLPPAEAVACFVRSLAASRPVLVVADDLHAASDAERSLVGRLAVPSEPCRVLVVATARTLRADAARSVLGPAAAVELEDLAVEAVASLLAEALGSDDLADRLAPEVHRRTSGNPLAVLETLDELRDAEVLVRDERGAWSLREGVEALTGPASPRAIVARRIAALSRPDRELLEVAACIGVSFDPALLAHALSRDPGRVLLRLARLERREHLLRETDGEMAFEHHEVRDAVIDALPAERSACCHHAIAEALEALAAQRGAPSPSDHAVIARHALLGSEPSRAAPHVVPALEWLRAARGRSEALALADSALGTASVLSGGSRVDALVLRARCRSEGSGVESARADCESAVSLAEELKDAARLRVARLLLAECCTLAGSLDEALDLAQAVLDDAAAAGDVELEAGAWTCIGAIHGLRGRYPEAVAAMRRQRDLRSTREQAERGEALYFLATALADAAEYGEAERVACEALPLLRAAGGRANVLVWTLSLQASLVARLGRREEAAAACDTAARIARSIGDLRMEASCRSMQGEHLRVLGRYAQAGPLLDRAVLLAQRTGDIAHEGQCGHHRGLLFAVTGRIVEALAAFERARDLAARCDTVAGQIRALSALATLHGRCGDAESARACADETARLAAGSPSDIVVAVAAGIRARFASGSGDTRRSALAEALAAARRLSLEVIPVLLLELARLDAAEGRRDDAVSAATEARELATRSRSPNWALDADALLVALGAADAGEVASRLAAAWERFDLFTRVDAAGVVARAADRPDLLDRARADIDFAASHAPPGRAASVRGHLERRLLGL